MTRLTPRTWFSAALVAAAAAFSLTLASSAACGPGNQSEYCSANYGLTGLPSAVSGRASHPAMDFPVLDSPSLPAAGQLIYADFKVVEAEARQLLQRNLDFRKDISPYRGNNSFDQLVRQFDISGGFSAPAPGQPGLTLQQRIDLADAELRKARDLYAYLAVFAPAARFRGDVFYTGAPPAGYPEALCGSLASKEDSNPPDPQFSGQVLDPIIDWCDFPARLRQSVREAAHIRMIFGQQFMVDALGLHFSGTEFYGGEEAVRKEVAKLRAARHQYQLAEKGLAEALTRRVGNGCLVSDFYSQDEWSLLSRAAESQSTAFHHIAVRQSYLGGTLNELPQAQANAVANYRAAALEGYVKMARMAGAIAAPDALGNCGAGQRPDGQLVADLAINMLQTRKNARDLSDGRNIFGFDVTFTPHRPYFTPVGSADRGLWNEAMDAATYARELEKDETQNTRVFDQTQQDLRNAINGIKTTLDMDISNQLGCTRAPGDANDEQFFACAHTVMTELQACLQYVRYESVAPANPLPGVNTFDQCMDRRNAQGPIIPASDARQTLFELRNHYLVLRGLKTRAENIDARIRLSEGRNATVTHWLGAAGGARTAADVSGAVVSMIGAAGDTMDVAKTAVAGVFGAIDIAAKAAAGAISTAADVNIANAETFQEVQNLLLDQSELLIDAMAAEQAMRAKLVQFEGILGHMEDVIAEARRQRAYLTLAPGNDPSYRIIRDSKRLELASQLAYASRIAYLTARRAEYEYAARLSASNFRISDIYRARTASDIIRYLQQLKSVTDSLAAGVSTADLNTANMTISVAQHVLGLTDAVLARQGFTTPETAEAERVRRFRIWVTANTAPNDFEAPFDNKPVLRFTFPTSLLSNGLFADVIQQGFDRFWLLKLGGIGQPRPDNAGVSVNLKTGQVGVSYRTASLTQGSMTHLRAFSGCVFNYRLMPTAVLLGLEWPANQKPEEVVAVLRANVNGGHAPGQAGFQTPSFLGRPVSSTDWRVLIFSGAPEVGMPDMDLQQLTDIELKFSTTYASRSPGQPAAVDCTRIDW